MAYAQVQTKEVHVNAVGGQTISVTMTSAYGPGNLAQVWAHDGDQTHATDFPSCADDRGAGNTYSEVTACRINDITDNNKTTGHYAKNLAGSGAPTVTLTWVNTAVTFRSVTVSEFSGLDTASPLIAGSATEVVNTGPGTDDISCAAINFTSQPGVLCAYARDDGPGGQEPTKGTGFSDGGSVHDAGSSFYRWEHKRVTVTGNATATFSSGAVTTDYNLMAMGFKEATGSISNSGMPSGRPASRFTGPVVQRFLFRQPNQLGRDPTLSPPEQIVQQGMTAVRPGNKFVGPQVLRQRFQVPQQAIATSNNVELIPSVGSIVVNGNAPTLLKVLGPSEGSIVVGGNAPSLLSVLVPTAGGIVVGGNAPALLLAIGPTQGSIIVGGNAPGLFSSLAPSTGSIVIDGYAPTISVGVILNPPEGSIVIGGNSPTLLSVLSPTQGSIIVGGNAPSIARLLSPTEGAVIVGGNAPSMALLLGPAEGAVLISGNAPTLLEVLVPGSGAIVIDGQVPDVVVFGGDQFLAPAEGLIIVDGNAPGLLIITPFVEQVGGSGGGGGGGGDPGRGGSRRNRPFKAVGKRRFILNGQVEGHTTLVKVVKTEVTKEDLAELTPDEQAAILAFIATL